MKNKIWKVSFSSVEEMIRYIEYTALNNHAHPDDHKFFADQLYPGDSACLLCGWINSGGPVIPELGKTLHTHVIEIYRALTSKHGAEVFRLYKRRVIGHYASRFVWSLYGRPAILVEPIHNDVYDGIWELMWDMLRGRYTLYDIKL